MLSSPIAIAKALYAALEAEQPGEVLGLLVTEDVVFTEHPNLIKPQGGRAGREQAIASSERGAQLLAWQRYDVRDAIEHGDTAIVRLTWTAEIAHSVGPFQAGQRLTAHIAQFIRCRGGRVAALETYDCYEPLMTAAGVV